MGGFTVWVFSIACCCIAGVCEGGNPPFVSFGPSSGMVIFSEDIALGTKLFAITATDADSTVVTITIDPQNAETNNLVKLGNVTNTGHTWRVDVLLKAALDRDRNPNLRTLVFKVADEQNELSGRVGLIIRDVNDNPPAFTNLPYRITLKENAAIDQSVFRVTAVDPDDGPGGSIRFFMSSDAQGADSTYNSTFVIENQSTGEIIRRQPLDYEKRNYYQFRVSARDGGNPYCPGPQCKCNIIAEPNVKCEGEPAIFSVTVEDVQDTPPIFERLPYIAVVYENATVGTSILAVSALDGDRGVPNSVTYSIAQDQQYPFAIDNTTGVITVSSPLDVNLPDTRRYTLTVQATEVTRPNEVQLGNTIATAKVYISVMFADGDAPDCFGHPAADVVTTAQPTRHHDVTCLDNRMSFSIPFPGNLPRAATLSDPRCHVDTAGGNLMGSINLNSCGTTVAFTNDSVIFRNVITITSADNSTGEEGLIPIQCKYDRFATVQLSYMPVVRHVLFTEVGIGQLSFRIQQFRDASYLTAVADSQYPLRMEPNERVYIQLSLGDVLSAGHKDDIGINVQECVASPFSTLLQAQSNSVPLIQESCPASNDVQLMTIYPEDIQRVRFSFKVVSFPDLQNQPGDFGLVFVHCRVSVCPADECSASNRTCPDPSAIRRVRRSAHDSVSTHQLSTGPFLVSEDKGGAVSSTTALAAVSMVVAAIATVVAMVAVVAWRRSRREAIGQKC